MLGVLFPPKLPGSYINTPASVPDHPADELAPAISTEAKKKRKHSEEEATPADGQGEGTRKAVRLASDLSEAPGTMDSSSPVSEVTRSRASSVDEDQTIEDPNPAPSKDAKKRKHTQDEVTRTDGDGPRKTVRRWSNASEATLTTAAGTAANAPAWAAALQASIRSLKESIECDSIILNARLDNLDRQLDDMERRQIIQEAWALPRLYNSRAGRGGPLTPLERPPARNKLHMRPPGYFPATVSEVEQLNKRGMTELLAAYELEASGNTADLHARFLAFIGVPPI